MSKKNPEHPETPHEEEDVLHASLYQWDGQNERGDWEPQDPEGYEEEDAAYDAEGDEADPENEWDEVDGCVMQVEILPETET
eukprot:8542533-Prorocentrum_lima.AAC.1